MTNTIPKDCIGQYCPLGRNHAQTPKLKNLFCFDTYIKDSDNSYNFRIFVPTELLCVLEQTINFIGKQINRNFSTVVGDNFDHRDLENVSAG